MNRLEEFANEAGNRGYMRGEVGHFSPEARETPFVQYYIDMITETNRANASSIVETYRSLFHLFPDNLDYGLLFASAQMHLSAADSLQILAVLRKLPPPLGDDARRANDHDQRKQHDRNCLSHPGFFAVPVDGSRASGQGCI